MLMWNTDFNDYYDIKLKRQNVANLRVAFPDKVFVEEGDIADSTWVQSVFASHDVNSVCHLAARAGVRASLESPNLYARTNIQGTISIFEAMRSSGINHVAMASSSSVYGSNTKQPFHEDDPVCSPCSPYAATKRAVELMASTYCHLYGMSISCLRFFTVYGPSGRPDMAPFKFIDRIARGVSIDQYGDGTSSRDYTYIDDIVDGIVRALDRPLGFQIFNLGNGNPVRLLDFISTIERCVGRCAIIRKLPMQSGDVMHTFADTSKAASLLGYRAQVSLAEGIRRTVEWYKTAFPVTATPSVPAQEQPAAAQATDDTSASMSFHTSTSTDGHDPSGASTVFSDLSAGSVRSGDGDSDSGDNEPGLHQLGDGSRLATCVRVHSMPKLSPSNDASLRKCVASAAAVSGHVLVAVSGGEEHAGLIADVQHILDDSRQSAQKQGLSTQFHIITVTPWDGFSPALNALARAASRLGCNTVCFQSAEVCLSPAAMTSLMGALDRTDALVVGAQLTGHEFAQGAQAITGTTCPWNTLAVWRLDRLLVTGFLTISDGVGSAVGQGGVEEIATVAALQRLLGASAAKAVLLQLPASKTCWNVHFDSDSRRKQHAAKMQSKVSRAKAQLDVLCPTGDAGWLRGVLVHHEVV